jgi:hypothetical protein
MSEPLRTHTERVRDQRRIEALQAELVAARQQILTLAGAYQDTLEALADAHEWRAMAALMALCGGILTVFAIRAFL